MYNTIKMLAKHTIDPVGDQDDQMGNGSGLVAAITRVINGVIAVLGIVCVVVMIVGGINYMTSAGDSNKVKKAKDTILYGLIGLVISVLAFAIVNFVISNVINYQGN